MKESFILKLFPLENESSPSVKTHTFLSTLTLHFTHNHIDSCWRVMLILVMFPTKHKLCIKTAFPVQNDKHPFLELSLILYFTNNYTSRKITAANMCQLLPCAGYLLKKVWTHTSMLSNSVNLKTPTQQNVRLCHKMVDNENIF